jgi:hypothetical protein
MEPRLFQSTDERDKSGKLRPTVDNSKISQHNPIRICNPLGYFDTFHFADAERDTDEEAEKIIYCVDTRLLHHKG